MSATMHSAFETGEQFRPQLAGREEYLQSLFGLDIDHARPYIDAFTVNVETGRDSLRHVLSGEVNEVQPGIKVAHGFHHEPSAEPGTYVDRSNIAALTSRDRNEFADRPFQPYRARSSIAGFPKRAVRANEKGDLEIVPQTSSMFPKEYDALAVVKTIVGARDSRDTNKDKILPDGSIATEGHWNMIDDKTMMRVSLNLDAEGKILGASPHVRRYLNITPEFIDKSLGLI